MVRLVIAVAVPLLAFGAFLLIRSARNDQQVIATTANERAQGAAEDLDRELHHLQDLLSVIASSDFLAGISAKAYLPRPLRNGAELGLVLWDISGEIVYNTCQADGRELVVQNSFRNFANITNYEGVNIPNIDIVTVNGNRIITVNSLIKQESNSLKILSLCALPRISEILTQQHLPAGWYASVIDEEEQIIAGASDPSGSPAHRDEGSAPIFSRDSKSSGSQWDDSHTAYRATSTVASAGWTVIVSIPNKVFFGPLRRSLLILFTAGGGTAGLVLLLAVTIGRRIAGPMIDLTSIAEALGNGARIAPPRTGIKEADVVAHALCSTSEGLSRRTEELTNTIQALRRSEKRLRRLSDDLRQALDERTKLLNCVVSAQEEERQRIARELHDQLGQYFATMLLSLDGAKRALGRDNGTGRCLEELKALALAMNRDVHQLAWELRPAALDDLGLEAAIAIYLEKWSALFKLDADFFGDLRGRRLSAPIEITLYRVFQEAMTNVAKHAKAARVSIVLNTRVDEVSLIVQDDGKGFAAKHPVVSDAQPSGFGILGIRERLALIGGSLAIETTPDYGTTLFCRVPI